MVIAGYNYDAISMETKFTVMLSGGKNYLNN